jgi:NADH-quinone oxidoreductase subunit N
MQTLVALSGLGLLTLFSEIFGFRKIVRPMIVVGLLLTLVLTSQDWNRPQHLFNDMLVIDNYAVAFSFLVVALTLVWLLLSSGFFQEPSTEVDRSALVVFALIGAVCMVNFNNMIMLFLGIEILSISMYILAGSEKNNLSSNEAALKYFLMGAFATGFLLFGIALMYGATGSFSLSQIATSVATISPQNSILVTVGLFMLVIAMAFKVSAAPFHFWAPDVYQGSPTPVTAYMSTVVKTAAFAAFFRLFNTCFAVNAGVWSETVMVISALTMLLGNIGAAAQSNIKRMLAYSSVAHAGYMLLAILALNGLAAGSMFYYATAYSISSLLAFFILYTVSNKTGLETVDAFRGLSRRSPVLTFLTVVSMLSLAGIPPTAGFFAKYYIFTAALDAGNMSLVLLAVAGSLVGVYYYFRPMIAAFSPPDNQTAISVEKPIIVMLLLLAMASLVLGIVPVVLVNLLG